LTPDDRRLAAPSDRRQIARGGRRKSDRPGRHPIVLVADAYEDARTPIVKYLDHHGFLVLEAASAAHAARLIEEHRPHVVMSGLLGHEAADFYAALSIAAAPQRRMIILRSGIDDPVPAQATSVITKPFSLRPMLEQVRAALRSVATRTA
jgi:DNA-binding response OmpR family regulator